MLNNLLGKVMCVLPIIDEALAEVIVTLDEYKSLGVDTNSIFRDSRELFDKSVDTIDKISDKLELLEIIYGGEI